MLTGTGEIWIITTPQDQAQFQNPLGDGSLLGLQITWMEQPRPGELTQAFLIAETVLDCAPAAMRLGERSLFCNRLPEPLASADAQTADGTVFGCRVVIAEHISTLGELELVTLLESFLHDSVLDVKAMRRGYAWLDTGTHAGYSEEIANGTGSIDEAALTALADRNAKKEYCSYLRELA
jgi:glucose-1-phosphate thymidylyltransferase